MREETGVIRSVRLTDTRILLDVEKSDGNMELLEAVESIPMVKMLIHAFGRVSNIVGRKVKYTVDLTGKLSFIDTTVPK